MRIPTKAKQNKQMKQSQQLEIDLYFFSVKNNFSSPFFNEFNSSSKSLNCFLEKSIKISTKQVITNTYIITHINLFINRWV